MTHACLTARPASLRVRGGRVAGAALTVVLFVASAIDAEPVAVRYPEATAHVLLRLRNAAGMVLAGGELTQQRDGTRVTATLAFRFRDGSLHEETTVFLQDREFRLVTNHLVQRGPAFPRQLEMSIDAASGNVTVRYTDGGEQKMQSAHFNLPPDMSNGIIPTLLRNVPVEAPVKSLSYVAATPQPRLVKLQVSVGGPDVTGGIRQPGTHYVVHVDLGRFTGALASLAGKQPPDSHVWILPTDPPAFAAAAQPFFIGAPLWRIELADTARP